MKIFTRTYKPTFEVDNEGLGVPLDQINKWLKETDELTKKTSVVLGGMGSINGTQRNFLRGIKDKCVQFEIVFEIKSDDNPDIFEGADLTNIADNILDLFVSSLEYSVLINQANITNTAIKGDSIYFTVDDKEIVYPKLVAVLNEDVGYKKHVKSFFKAINTIDNITSFSLYNGENVLEFEITKEQLISIDTELPLNEVLIKEIQVDMNDCAVIPIKVILKQDMRRKWAISFTPKVPDHLILDFKSEYEAYIDDKLYVRESLVEDRFQIGDYIICDLTYKVIHNENSLLASIRDVRISKVKEHKHGQI
jgi:hypothetical protein